MAKEANDQLQKAIVDLKAEVDRLTAENEELQAGSGSGDSEYIESLEAERDSLREQVEELRSQLSGNNAESVGPKKKFVELTALRTYGYCRLNDKGATVEVRTVEPGEVVIVTEEQAAHGIKYGALGTNDEYLASLSSASQQASDDELLSKGLPEMLSYLSQHSNDDDEIARIEALELSRDIQRSEVLDAIEKIRSVKQL